MGPRWPDCDLFLSSLSAPSLYPSAPLPPELSICLDSIDFFRRRPPPEPSRFRESGDSDDPSSPDRRLICFTLVSTNVLNSFGANSGCNLAGTQYSREAASSSSAWVGARVGMKEALLKDGKSGSPAALTSIDIRRKACRLLNS